MLARNVTTFFELYDDDVMDTLVEMGFTQKFNEPVLIEQFTECVYSDDVYDDVTCVQKKQVPCPGDDVIRHL